MTMRVGWLVLAMMMAASLGGATRQRDTSGIAAVRAEWAKDLHDKKLDAFVALYTPEGQFLTETGDRFAGHDAIRELGRKAMDMFSSDLTFESKVTDISGELAYDSGDYHETLVTAADGKVLHIKGTYIMVLRRQTNGRWLIAAQMWSAAPSSDALPH